jgi:transcriptional regulator with XRE-family HTH domain
LRREFRAVRLALKTAIFQRGISQRETAVLAVMDPSRLSLIVNGWVNPTASERARLAAVLKQSEEVLFDGGIVELRSSN